MNEHAAAGARTVRTPAVACPPGGATGRVNGVVTPPATGGQLAARVSAPDRRARSAGPFAVLTAAAAAVALLAGCGSASVAGRISAGSINLVGAVGSAGAGGPKDYVPSGIGGTTTPAQDYAPPVVPVGRAGIATGGASDAVPPTIGAPSTAGSTPGSIASRAASGAATTAAAPRPAQATKAAPRTAPSDPPATVSSDGPMLTGWVPVVPSPAAAAPLARQTRTTPPAGAAVPGPVTGTTVTTHTPPPSTTYSPPPGPAHRAPAEPGPVLTIPSRPVVPAPAQLPAAVDTSVPESSGPTPATPILPGTGPAPTTVTGIWYDHVCGGELTLRTLGPHVVSGDFAAQLLAVRRSYLHLAATATATARELRPLPAPSYYLGELAKAKQLSAFQAIAAGYRAGAKLLGSPVVASPAVLASTVAEVETDVRGRVASALAGSPAVPDAVQAEIRTVPSCQGLS